MGNLPATPILEVGGLRLDVGAHELYLNGNLVELTPTEFKLLLIFMEHPGYTFTREELLERALGYAYEGMGRTLDTHIRNLRRKIEVNPKQPHYIQTVYSVGYRFVGDNR